MTTTTKKVKEPVIHLDKLGQTIEEGNYVAGCHRNSMYICKILKCTAKQIRINDIKSLNKRHDAGWLVYPGETVKLSGEDAIAYILKYA
jgi:hypothetical protein